MLAIRFILVKSKNYTELERNLRQKFRDEGSNAMKLACMNNQNRPVPCPRGYCQLNSGGNSIFHRQCSLRSPMQNSAAAIVITSVTVGEEETEAMFTYECATTLCNNETTANEVRALLNQTGLLAPRGVVVPPTIPDPPTRSLAPTLVTMDMIVSSLLLSALIFFRLL